MPGGFGVGFGEIYRGGGRVVFYICHLWTWKDGGCFVLGGASIQVVDGRGFDVVTCVKRGRVSYFTVGLSPVFGGQLAKA